MRFCLPSPVPGSCDDMIAYAEGPVGNKLDRPGDLGPCFRGRARAWCTLFIPLMLVLPRRGRTLRQVAGDCRTAIIA